MQSALASLSASRQQTPASVPAHPSKPLETPSNHPLPDLDLLRLRLVKLIDALTVLHSQLSYLSFSTPTPTSLTPGLLPFQDLVARYNLLLSHLTAVQGLLSSQADKEKEGERDREQGPLGQRRKRKDKDRDLKRERWEAVSVVPAVPVDEGKDWLVGMLLRTKQIPEVETSQTTLITTLPSPFSSAVISSTPSTSNPTPDPAAFLDALSAHANLVTTAYDRITALKEFNSENEEWDWKARVDLDEENEEQDGGGEGKGKGDQEMQDLPNPTQTARSWTAKEVQVYMRTGKKPDN
ncbi:hypothetical protein JCM11641_000338 [Rhodosporidiobolus odoratus]